MSDAPQNVTPRSSRRDFITRSSAAVAAGGLALNFGTARFAHGAGADETIKIGVIGCGGRGTGAAIATSVPLVLGGFGLILILALS